MNDNSLCRRSCITSNNKYEITDIIHEEYPFLHRIRALRDVGAEVKAGDLGGFVENESNLSSEPRDDAWIYEDAIAAGDAYVDQGACLRGKAVACDQAYVSQNALLAGTSRAEDSAYICGGVLLDEARCSGSSMVLPSPDTHNVPVLSGECAVYGKVVGDVGVQGNAVILEGETIQNNSLDRLLLDERGRSILRDPSRDELAPSQSHIEKEREPRKKKKREEQSR